MRHRWSIQPGVTLNGRKKPSSVTWPLYSATNSVHYETYNNLRNQSAWHEYASGYSCVQYWLKLQSGDVWQCHFLQQYQLLHQLLPGLVKSVWKDPGSQSSWFTPSQSPTSWLKSVENLWILLVLKLVELRVPYLSKNLCTFGRN